MYEVASGDSCGDDENGDVVTWDVILELLWIKRN